MVEQPKRWAVKWTVPKVAAFLFAAVLRLARVCDGARRDDGQGFNKFDSERGHRFAQEDCSTWDAEKCSYVRRFIWKYRKQLLEDHDIDLTLAPDAKQLQYLASRTIDFTPNYGGQLVLAWDYNDAQFAEIKNAVKELDQRRYQGGAKVWVVPVELSDNVVELAERFGFKLSTRARKIIDSDETFGELENIRVSTGYGNILFDFPYDPDMLRVLKQSFHVRRWDRDNRVWRVNAETDVEVGAVFNFADRFNLTISEEARDKLEAIIQDAHQRAAEASQEEPEHKPEPDPESPDKAIAEASKMDEEQPTNPDGNPLAKWTDPPSEKRDEPVEEMGREWNASKALDLFK